MGAAGRVALLKTLFPCILALAVAAAARGDGGSPGSADDDAAYETDRPGEVENPYTLRPGRTELVTYVAAMNAAAREDQFGEGGSAVVLDTAVRFGLAGCAGGSRDGGHLPGSIVFRRRRRGDRARLCDAASQVEFPEKWFGRLRGRACPLRARADQPADRADFPHRGGPDPALQRGPRRRLGAGRLNFGGARPEGGRGLGDRLGRTGKPAAHAGGAASTAYAELQLEAGDDLPAWGVEGGATLRLNGSALLDVGGSQGIGRNSRGRMGYIGLGWRF